MKITKTKGWTNLEEWHVERDTTINVMKSYLPEPFCFKAYQSTNYVRLYKKKKVLLIIPVKVEIDATAEFVKYRNKVLITTYSNRYMNMLSALAKKIERETTFEVEIVKSTYNYGTDY